MFTDTAPVTLQSANAHIFALASEELMKLVQAGHVVTDTDIQAIRDKLEQSEKSISRAVRRYAINEKALAKKADEELDKTDPGFRLRTLFNRITKGS